MTEVIGWVINRESKLHASIVAIEQSSPKEIAFEVLEMGSNARQCDGNHRILSMTLLYPDRRCSANGMETHTAE